MIFESNLNPIFNNEKVRIFFLTLLISFTPVFFLGWTDFYTRGEPREALIAQALYNIGQYNSGEHNSGGYNSGEYVLPRGYNDAIPSKPPLLHWFIVFVSKLNGGINEFTCRLPSLFAATVFLGFFSLFLLKRYTFDIAFLVMSITALSFEWSRAAVSCRVDMIHSASLAGGLLAFFNYWENKGGLKYSQRYRFNYPLNYLCVVFALTLSVLSKGPVSVVLPSIIITAFCLIKKVKISQIIKVNFLIFIPVILISSVWYLLAYRQAGALFVEKFNYENIKRFTSSMEDSPHRHGLFYLIAVFFAGLLPWSFFIFSPFKKIFFKECSLREYFLRTKTLNKSFIFEKINKFKERFKFKSFFEFINQLEKKESFELFCIISVAVIFIFYSIPSSKRGVYLLSAYPFICFLLLTKLLSEKSNFLKKMIYVVLGLNLFFQAVIHPIVSKVDSDKINAKTIGTLLSGSISGQIPTQKIYSYMNEFYGMSFYLNKRFYSLNKSENNINSSINNSSKVSFSDGDLIILKQKDYDLFKTNFSVVSFEEQSLELSNGYGKKELIKVLKTYGKR